MKTAKPNLITDVQVKSATAADKDFLEGGIEGSAEVTGTLAEHVNADRAYQSDGNRDFTADNLIELRHVRPAGQAFKIRSYAER